MKKFALAAALIVACSGAARADETAALKRLPISKPSVVEAYGKDPLQFGRLRVPAGKGPFPVAIVLHGGCRIKGIANLDYLDPLASALADEGIATWNVEYRQLGDPGAGWPGTFADWAAATDHLRDLAKRYPLDLGQIVAVGHSAGGHAALWLAGRPRLPASSVVRGADPLPIRAAVNIDGSGDMSRFPYQSRACNMVTSVIDFFGGTPREVPDHYRQGNPIEMLPTGVKAGMLTAAGLLPEEAERYRLVAAARGDSVAVLDLAGASHFDMLDPTTPTGRLAIAYIRQILSTAKQ